MPARKPQEPMMHIDNQDRQRFVILSAAKDQRSEASVYPSREMLRCAQDDKTEPALR
jgi:hypothetical protein